MVTAPKLQNTQPDYTKAIEAADKLLRDNQITKPPVPLVELATNHGYSVQIGVFPNDLLNVCGYIDINKKVIMTNASDSPNRRAFTIAHELGHLLLHEDELRFNSDLGVMLRAPLGKQELDPREKEANAFAANLLVPAKMLKPYIEEPDRVIAALFGVSEDVIRYRKLSLQKI